MSDLLKSLQRAARVLDCFSEAEPELGVTEIAVRLNLPKTTVARILATMLVEDWVGQNPATSKYHLGVGLIGYAGLALGRLDVRAIAQPYLADLVNQQQETASVSILDDMDCVSVARMSSPHALRYVDWIGRRMPLYCTAPGRVLLAWRTEEERQQLLPSKLKQFTAQTLTNQHQLEKELDQVQQHGVAVVNGEYEEGFTSIAGPIFNYSGQVVAAIAISGPTFRFGDESSSDCAQTVAHIAAKASADMGFVAAK